MSVLGKSFIGSMIQSILGSLPLVCTFLFITLPAFKAITLDDNKHGLSVAVNLAITILDSYREKADKGDMTK